MMASSRARRLLVCIGAMLALMPLDGGADDYARLDGSWQCQEEGEASIVEFLSPSHLLYNGEASTYRLLPGVLRVAGESGSIDYRFQLSGDTLTIASPDGSVMSCARTKTRSAPAHQAAPAAGTQAWPPPYARPAGPVNEDAPGAQALLYKFAGRWDHVTSHTLTNLFLKPDGTYEEAYEAGYSGQFTDQGGFQTGHWGTTGTSQARGRWFVEGTLKQGRLTLVDQGGNQRIYSYRVHVRNREYFWGEYFFDRALYAVRYIYR